MILVVFICLVLGAALAWGLQALSLVGPIKGIGGLYMAVACLAGMDSILGGLRSGLEGKFRNDVFITGFFSNMLIAFFVAWLGDRIGIDLFLVAGLVLGTRVFTNLSLIRRYLLTKWQDSRERKKMQQQRQAQDRA